MMGNLHKTLLCNVGNRGRGKKNWCTVSSQTRYWDGTAVLQSQMKLNAIHRALCFFAMCHQHIVLLFASRLATLFLSSFSFSLFQTQNSRWMTRIQEFLYNERLHKGNCGNWSTISQEHWGSTLQSPSAGPAQMFDTYQRSTFDY
jgi:hypothetical protein